MPAGLKTKKDKCPVIPVLAPFLPDAAGEGKKEATGDAPMESFSDDGDSPSSGSDEEDSDSNDEGVKREDADSDSD